jgi:hypothetical protein
LSLADVTHGAIEAGAVPSESSSPSFVLPSASHQRVPPAG